MRGPIAETKRALRRDFIARRAALDDRTRLVAGRRALLHLVGALELCPESVVAAFWPMPAEPDTRPLFEALAALRVTTALPRVVGQGAPLAFHRFRPGNPLVEAGMRVFEPLPTAPLVRPTIVVVPMVAFDARGYRLGYGGGFYDRTLAGLGSTLGPDHVAIGLAFEVQRASDLPHVATDVRLSTIVTETGVHHFPG
jgi:5-formyltetrahydrofolate cyclo-ligase